MHPGVGTRLGLSAAKLGLTAAAAELGILFIGASLPTPLYPLYGAAFGFGKTTLTLVYAVYVLVT